VKRAHVRLETEEARVVYDDTKQTPEKLTAAIDRLGFQASAVSVTAAPKPTLYVDGLTELKAVRKVEQVLKAVKGVKGVTVDPKDGEVFVEYESQAVTPWELVAVLKAAGFTVRTTRRLVATVVVTFGSGRWELDQKDQAELLKAVTTLKETPNLEVELEGYTDNVGSRAANLQLSQRRAESVWRFLVEKGVSSGRVQSTGVGDAHPITDNATKEGRAQNRRVVIKLFDVCATC